MKRWLMKSEPDAYGWDDLVREGLGTWDGVRNHQAANNMKAMKKGDEALFYHSVTGKAVVGIMQIVGEAAADPTDAAWWAVKVAPVRPLARPVTLAEMKAVPALADLAIIRQSRLSVAPVTADQWRRILKLAEG